jgi:thymidylate synthase (FAD)
MIIERGHESVIEHESLSVRFICDRGVTHEIVRHRLAAYSQESTRYCDYTEDEVTFIIPPWLNVEPGTYHLSQQIIQNHKGTVANGTYYWVESMLDSERHYKVLRQHNWTPQQARAVLPNSLKTEIVMTANLREWRHVLKLRTSKAAHPQMRELMIPLLRELQNNITLLFGDIEAEE